MRPTLIPAKLKLRGKIHNVIFLWNETWGDTDDFFFVLERNTFKPYFRNKIYNIDGTELYPHYHYTKESFNEALNDFLATVPLTRVIIQGRACYLLYDFGNEYWAFDVVRNVIDYTTVTPKRSSVPFKADVVRAKLAEYIMNGVIQRIEFAGSHLLHLQVIAPKKR